MSRWLWHANAHSVACTPTACVLIESIPDTTTQQLWRLIDGTETVEGLKAAIDSVAGQHVSAVAAIWNREGYDCAVRGIFACQNQPTITGTPEPTATISASDGASWTDGRIDGDILAVGTPDDLGRRAYRFALGETDVISGWGHATVVMAHRPEPLDMVVEVDDEDDATIVGVDWEDDVTMMDSPPMPDGFAPAMGGADPYMQASGDASMGVPSMGVPLSSGPSAGEPPGATQVYMPFDESPQIAQMPLSDTVTSLRCAQGHDNPPATKTCLQCGASLKEGYLVDIPQPVIGHVRLPSGRIVDIRDDIVFGRMPRGMDRSGRPTPLLVPVASPHALISRTHCEIRVEGWEAYVIDHNSNNGTFVLRDNEHPIQVLPGYPVQLRPGDTIDLGENVHIDIGDLI